MIFEIEKPLFGTMIIEQGLFIVQLKQKKDFLMSLGLRRYWLIIFVFINRR